ASEVAQKATSNNTMVVELSSFQLMGIKTFRPHIAIVTNLYEAHLDYHDSWEEYANAKMNITKNQLESDYVIVNADQKEVMELISFTKAKIIPFSTKKFIQDGASIRNGMLTFMGEDIISLEKIVLPGAHNLENILSATAAVKLMGVDNEAI